MFSSRWVEGVKEQVGAGGRKSGRWKERGDAGQREVHGAGETVERDAGVAGAGKPDSKETGEREAGGGRG